MLIRPATGDDWRWLWPLWRAVVAAGDSYTYAPDTAKAAARGLWMLQPPAEAWLAEDGPDRPALGTYLLKPNHPGPGAHVANAGFMVSPDAQGQGIGRLLGLHCLERAREIGFLAMQFNAVVSTNAPAIALWRSLGFDTVGRVPRRSGIRSWAWSTCSSCTAGSENTAMRRYPGPGSRPARGGVRLGTPG